MNYIKKPFVFKIKKVFRYFKLYGIQRTLIKVRSQYHMDKKYLSLPVFSCGNETGKAHVGIIGCGNYSYGVISYYLRKYNKRLIRGVMDIDIHKSASLFQSYGVDYYTDDENEIIRDPKINLVYIASNHASHAEYAIKCLDKGKSVHIEKPHVVTEDQLLRLSSAMKSNPDSKVFLGFNRPRSKLFKELLNLMSKQDGPSMINWFIAGHEIPADHWYFDEKEGGRVLGNLCHWSDLTLHLVGLHNAFPCQVIPASPTGAKSDFVVSIIFADNSCASITFSAKGHTFEGVREVLNVHKGNLLGNLTDFHSLSVEIVDKKLFKKQFYRDHGHKVNVLNSLLNEYGEDQKYVIATAKLFLTIREAIDTGQKLTLSVEQAFGIYSTS